MKQTTFYTIIFVAFVFTSLSVGFSVYSYETNSKRITVESIERLSTAMTLKGE